MPQSWFFEIHEDTPEQEASNLMEHSAAVLDISSDDDLATKSRNEELERGKENIPPPDFSLSQPRAHAESEEVALDVGVKMPRLREMKQDAMDEDRRPLGDLPAAEFYAEGCDKDSYVTVDTGIEKPSALSKEFDFNCLTPEKPRPLADVIEVAEKVEEGIAVYADEPVADENAAPAISSSEPQTLTSEAS